MFFRPYVASLAVLAALTGPAGAVNLVANPGFEDSTPFNGWTVNGDGILLDNAFPNSGLYDAAFAAPSTDPDPGVLSQVLTTTPGQSYVVSFALLDEAGSFGDTFTVTFGGFSQTITGDQAASPGTNPSSGYTSFSFTTLSTDITAAATTLSFTGVNDPAAWNLDDVSVAVPAPVAGVPEPSTWAMMLLGFGGLGFAGYRRSRAVTA
jgi:hypothetical protein